ncbi:ATP-binding protein [Geomonas sp. RF6]|uniref:GAF domain-containing sensor histidine kinase n=1 Tax=Geomonas sp. RF6 TaxID=2897342 RepID=UPI001E58CD58|nr:ATP-binding protein [Geomonas sp. RF6]UFS72675.1 ATP-binding protein [Geomonas sp. RF6]
MNQFDVSEHVADPERLAALRAVALLDTPTEEAFDRLAWLATRSLHAPVALVSLVDADRQFFKSCIGLPEPWQAQRETPLTHSFCKYNRVAGKPLVIEDARQDPLFRDNLAVKDLNVIAYLGMPLVTADGYILGSFCVIDGKPRQWTEEEISIVAKLSYAVMTEIQLRTEIAVRIKAEEALVLERAALTSEVAARLDAEERLKAQHGELREAYEKLQKETADRLSVSEQLRLREHMLLQQSRLAAMGEMISNIAHQWRQPLNLMALLAQDIPATFSAGGVDDEYINGNVGKMMAAINHMSETIDNFRHFFSPTKAKVPFCIAEMVHRTVALLSAVLDGAEIKVTVSGSKPILTGFPREYSQVILNIFMNALDAFASRQVNDRAIRVEIGSEGEKSMVRITDNAGGIPEDIVEKIFDPYFTTKEPGKGTGIGLYMSKMIIERSMSGSLMVENVPGGASFIIKV